MVRLSFSSFDLKLLAVLFMIIDHIGMYFADAPLWFRYIGRLSFPLFLFCLVWSYHHTHSRVQFCLRLYLMSLCMAGLRWWIENRWLPEAGTFGNHNIFATLLLTCLLISLIELAGRDKLRCGLLLGLLLAMQLAYYILPRYVPQLRHISGDILSGIIPNLALCEFGAVFIALGVAMYFLRERPAGLAAVYLVFCVYLLSDKLLNGGWPQIWYIVGLAAALPFMLAYNRRKGRGWKWFFYIFYPAHLVLLFYVARVLLN